MRAPFPLWILIPVLAALVLVAFFVFRAPGMGESGPPNALCPGPDQYGYTCVDGSNFEYIDATHDTGLYEDDGLVEITLPFEFRFYGSAYRTVYASSNGNLQFSSTNAAFENACLITAPAEQMGDMIAPYWDDLDLTFSGTLQTEIIGTAPRRAFVVEWDNVPSFDNPEDLVTFEVQLHESNNDIVFLYADTTRFRGNRGSSATVGLQSEERRLSLQYGCNQPVLADGAAIQFVHPTGDGTGGDGPEEIYLQYRRPVDTAPVKGETKLLLASLNQRGLSSLPGLKAHWLGRSPRRDSRWVVADMNDDGQRDLVFLWTSPSPFAYSTHLAVLTSSNSGGWQLDREAWPFARPDFEQELNLHEPVDVTGNGENDLLLSDEISGRSFAFLTEQDHLGLQILPGHCFGSLIVLDTDVGGVPDIVRDGCEHQNRTVATWAGGRFVYR